MRKVWLCLFLALVLAVPAISVLAEDEGRPLTQEELAQAQAGQADFEAEIQKYVQGLLQRTPAMGTPTPFTGNFFAKDKSSNPNHAYKKVVRNLEAQINAWIQSITNQGYMPLENPEPQYSYKYKWNISNFKFKLRVWLTVKVWCQKMPG